MGRLAGRHFLHSMSRARPGQHTLFDRQPDSNLPQAAILKEKLLVDMTESLQTVARDSPHIVAF
jgi:hypothetical protein